MAGGIVAVLGYRTWHRQILGKAEHDVARGVLSGAFKVREEIRSVRRPASFPASVPADEGEDPKKALDEEALERRAHLQDMKDLARMYGPRLDRLREKLVDLELLVLDAEALWGVEAKAAARALLECAEELRTAVWEHFWLNGLYAPLELEEHDVDRSPDRAKQTWRIMWDASARKRERTDDAFAQRVQRAVAAIESFYRPKLTFRRR